MTVIRMIAAPLGRIAKYILAILSCSISSEQASEMSVCIIFSHRFIFVLETLVFVHQIEQANIFFHSTINNNKTYKKCIIYLSPYLEIKLAF